MKKLPLHFLFPSLPLPPSQDAGARTMQSTSPTSGATASSPKRRDFSLTVSCISREVPYAADGVACTRSDLIEIVLKPAADRESENAIYSVTLHGTPAVSGELSYRSVKGDYFLSQGVSAFPEGSVTVRLSDDGETTEITATSVKTEKTLSPEEALRFAVDAERELIGRMTAGSTFEGEFTVRLMRRSRNYYFVGITGKKENAALLIDAETGEVLARRVR